MKIQNKETKETSIIKHLVNTTIQDPEGVLGSIVFWTEIIGGPILFTSYIAYKTYSLFTNPAETNPELYKLCSDISNYIRFR